MSIPAGNVRNIITAHGLVLDDKVLERFVQSVTDVDRAVGIGRTVMEHERLFVLVAVEHLLVDLVVFPELDRFRLLFRQSCPHRERSNRQMKR